MPKSGTNHHDQPPDDALEGAFLVPKNFSFGPVTVAPPRGSTGITARALAREEEQPPRPLGPLENFTGTFQGEGFNLIFRPQSTQSLFVGKKQVPDDPKIPPILADERESRSEVSEHPWGIDSLNRGFDCLVTRAFSQSTRVSRRGGASAAVGRRRVSRALDGSWRSRWPLSIPGLGSVERGVRGAPYRHHCGWMPPVGSLGHWVGIEAVSTTRGVDCRSRCWWVSAEGKMVPTMRGSDD